MIAIWRDPEREKRVDETSVGEMRGRAAGDDGVYWDFSSLSLWLVFVAGDPLGVRKKLYYLSPVDGVANDVHTERT